MPPLTGLIPSSFRNRALTCWANECRRFATVLYALRDGASGLHFGVVHYQFGFERGWKAARIASNLISSAGRPDLPAKLIRAYFQFALSAASVKVVRHTASNSSVENSRREISSGFG